MIRLKAAATTGVDMEFPVARNTPDLLIPANCSTLNPCNAHRSMGCKHRDKAKRPDELSYCNNQMRSLPVRKALTTPLTPKSVAHLASGLRSKLTVAKHAGYLLACSLATTKFCCC